MDVLADVRQVANRRDHPLRDVAWVRARKANAFDALDVVHAFEERREIAGGIVRRLIVIHDLTEQVNLLPASRRRFPDLREDVGHGAHPLVPARERHHAERAEVVAAFDDRDPRLQRIASSRDAKRKRHVVVRIDVDDGFGAARLLHEHRQALQALRAYDDVDR